MTAQTCGWNGCTVAAEDYYDGYCQDHQWSQCRTPGCEDDADDGEGWEGYCGNCADRLEAAGAFD